MPESLYEPIPVETEEGPGLAPSRLEGLLAIAEAAGGGETCPKCGQFAKLFFHTAKGDECWICHMAEDLGLERNANG